jgi:hypothetical protein
MEICSVVSEIKYECRKADEHDFPIVRAFMKITHQSARTSKVSHVI